jgi:hypothetical protein
MALSSRRLPFLLRVPASPVPRSQRYYEGATTSHSLIRGHSLVRFRSPPDPPASCPTQRSRKVGGPFQARALGWPAARLSGISRVDANGISQVFRRSFPCLCSVPRPRSNRCALASDGHIDAAPATHTAKASALADFGADSRSFGTALPTLRASCCHSRARLASGRLAGLCREGVEPSGPLRKVSVRLTIVLLSCSPDANGFRYALPILQPGRKDIPCTARTFWSSIRTRTPP